MIQSAVYENDNNILILIFSVYTSKFGGGSSTSWL